MRKTLTIALLLVAGLAGCLGSDDAPDTPDDGMDDSMLGPGANGIGDLLAEAPQVDAAALISDLRGFAAEHNERRNNLPTHESARLAMMDMFASYGLEVYRQNFTNGIEQANIIGIKWGQDRDHWVVVGAHYDTTTDDCVAGGLGPADCPLSTLSQGFYDDGSGTMMTLHLAKAFANTNTNYTMAFVAYDGEERGTQGARAFVQAFQIGDPDMETPYGLIDVVGDVDLDMIGLNWPGVNAPINIMTNSDVLYGAAVTKAKELGFPDEQLVRKDSLQLGSSDYARFWEVSAENGGPIPTIFFISDFEEVGAPAPTPEQAHTPTPVGVYPFWHFEDTYETTEAMAGGPVLGPENMRAGFQSAVDIASDMLWRMATTPDFGSDAVVM